MLRISENICDSLFDTTGGATAIIDGDTTISMVNNEFVRLFGYTREEVVGKISWTSFVPGHEVQRLRTFHEMRRIDPASAPQRYESIMICSNGKIINVYISVSIIAGTDKSVVTIIDITETKRAQTILEEQTRLTAFSAGVAYALSREDNLHGMLKGCTDAALNNLDVAFCFIWLLNGDGDHLELQASSGIHDNPASALSRIPVSTSTGIGEIAISRIPILTGIAEGSFKCPQFDWVCNSSLKEEPRAFAGLPLMIEQRTIGVFALFFKHKPTEFMYRAFVSASDNIAAGIMRKYAEEELRKKQKELLDLNCELEKRVALEIEHRRQKEQMLLQQSKMAAMGEMIAAIAHQWRQPLNSVGLIAQDLEDAHDFGELDKDYITKSVSDIMNQVDFMSHTIDDFRSFFRPSKEKSAFDCVTAIKDVFHIISAQLDSHSIRVRIDEMNERPHLINGYPNEFKQAMLNFFNNSKDAIVNTRKQGLLVQKEGEIRVEISSPNGRCLIKVSDNGGGIPEGIKERIFEPYFTTREQGNGTGIGLYMAKTIIETNMNGNISFRNNGLGAEFTIEI